MRISFATSRYSTSRKRDDRQLERRKGGGGKGGGGGGKSSSGGGSTSGGTGRSAPVSAGGVSGSSSAYGSGGGKVSNIGSGSLFAGRSQGGGTRDQVVGTRTYGSGYPGVAGAGVAGRGFPFFFWPVAWGGAAGFGTAAYLHNNEYGDSRNGSRPGGQEQTAFFKSISDNTTFRILSDNSTVNELIFDIRSNCSSQLDSITSTASTTFNEGGSAPRPEQAIQYYRASSVVLTLDGYNNTGIYGNGDGPDSPLPASTNQNLLNCVNGTIAAAAPLLDAATLPSPQASLGLLWLVWLTWFAAKLV